MNLKRGKMPGTRTTVNENMYGSKINGSKTLFDNLSAEQGLEEMRKLLLLLLGCAVQVSPTVHIIPLIIYCQ